MLPANVQLDSNPLLARPSEIPEPRCEAAVIIPMPLDGSV